MVCSMQRIQFLLLKVWCLYKLVTGNFHNLCHFSPFTVIRTDLECSLLIFLAHKPISAAKQRDGLWVSIVCRGANVHTSETAHDANLQCCALGKRWCVKQGLSRTAWLLIDWEYFFASSQYFLINFFGPVLPNVLATLKINHCSFFSLVNIDNWFFLEKVTYQEYLKLECC